MNDDEKTANTVKNMTRRVKQNVKHGRLEPRVNAYVCTECGHITYTVDCAEGTTPFTLACQKKSSILDMNGKEVKPCNGNAMSSMYSITPADYDWPEDITHEWYAPSIEEYNKIKKNKSRAVLDHVTLGGLLLRERTNHPVLTHGDEFIDAEGNPLNDAEIGALRSGLERLRVATELTLASRKRKDRIRDEQARQRKAKARAKRKTAKANKRRSRR